jgi:azurin
VLLWHLFFIFMDSHHTHEKRSIWTLINFLFGVGFALFAAVAGAALIYGGIKNSRAHGPQPVAAAAPAAPAAAPAGGTGTGTTPAPATPTTPGAAPAAAAPATSAGAPAGGVAEFTLHPGAANPMSFDTASITVKAGQKVKITFSNDSNVPLQHNFVLGKAGSKDRLIALANTMMVDMGKWLPLGFIPDSPDVIAHTKLLNPKESGTVEFTAPAEPGDCPYLCTFPGHAMIMNGVMKVE